MLIFLTAFAPVYAWSADVDVYAEGAYTESILDVYVYADINIDSILSFGVKLTYDPGELAVLSAEKDVEPRPYTSNGTKWLMGDENAAYKNNPPPDFSTAGEVIIIGGKLDPDNPAAGVESGARIFLGMASFTAANGQMPAHPAITLSYARGVGSYKNFVRLNGGAVESLDGAGVEIGAIQISPRGDADGNGSITPRDINRLKSNMGNVNAPCFMDCDGNGSITPKDINCIKGKM
ncbi:MAG: hypothetical protein GY859_16290 [Desulfobacterales bacterium]|nr:hypothetical protein [Desulfobacterales bacterium]